MKLVPDVVENAMHRKRMTQALVLGSDYLWRAKCIQLDQLEAYKEVPGDDWWTQLLSYADMTQKMEGIHRFRECSTEPAAGTIFVEKNNDVLNIPVAGLCRCLTDDCCYKTFHGCRTVYTRSHHRYKKILENTAFALAMDKTEAVRITKRRKETTVRVRIGKHIIIKYFGVVRDAKLKFKLHLQHFCPNSSKISMPWQGISDWWSSAQSQNVWSSILRQV